MPSSCIQSYQDSLVHESQMRFVNPSSLNQAQGGSDYYMSPTSKQKELQSRRFSYADMLSGQSANGYDQDPCYLSLTSSSPSDDSEDYQNSSSSTSDSSPAQDQGVLLDSSSTSSASSVLNEAIAPTQAMQGHHHPTSPGFHSADSVFSQPSASVPFQMMCSPTPSVVEPHFLQQQQHQQQQAAHRHSIANPPGHLHPFYDHAVPRHHHSFSHQQMYDQHHHAHHQQHQQHQHAHHQQRHHSMVSMPSTPSSYGTPTRPMTPVSPHVKDETLQQQQQQQQQQQHSQPSLMNDLCLSIPPSSMFPMSNPMYMSNNQSTTQANASANVAQQPYNGQQQMRRRGMPPNAAIKDDKVKKTPRSRGRRVSNIPSSGSRMFTCKADGCGKVFKRSEHLKRHIRSIHTLEKPFACPYQSCNKRFSRSDNLNQHIRIHRHSSSGASKQEKQNKQAHSSTPSAPQSDNQPFTNYVQSFM